LPVLSCASLSFIGVSSALASQNPIVISLDDEESKAPKKPFSNRSPKLKSQTDQEVLCADLLILATDPEIPEKEQRRYLRQARKLAQGPQSRGVKRPPEKIVDLTERKDAFIEVKSSSEETVDLTGSDDDLIIIKESKEKTKPSSRGPITIEERKEEKNPSLKVAEDRRIREENDTEFKRTLARDRVTFKKKELEKTIEEEKSVKQQLENLEAPIQALEAQAKGIASKIQNHQERQEKFGSNENLQREILVFQEKERELRTQSEQTEATLSEERKGLREKQSALEAKKAKIQQELTPVEIVL